MEKLLVEGIKKKFPDHQFIGEEDSGEGKKHILTDGTVIDVHTWLYSLIILLDFS